MPVVPINDHSHNSAVNRSMFTFGPRLELGAGAATLRTYQRHQITGASLNVLIRNCSRVAATFSLQQSTDNGVADAYATLNFELNAASVSSVLLQPGGVANIIVRDSERYIRFRCDDVRAFGDVDISFSRGGLVYVDPQQTTTPITALPVSTDIEFDSGVVAHTGGGSLERLYTITLNPDVHQGRTLFTATVVTGTLTGFRIVRTNSSGAPAYTLAENAALTTLSSEILYALPASNIHLTANPNSFQLGLNNAGVETFELWANAAVATTLRFRGNIT